MSPRYKPIELRKATERRPGVMANGTKARLTPVPDARPAHSVQARAGLERMAAENPDGPAARHLAFLAWHRETYPERYA